MLPFHEVRCPCGRGLRARAEQAGSSIRCWDCGRDVPVPHPGVPRARLVRTLTDAAREGLRRDTVARVFAGALALTVLLLVPKAGAFLALGALAVAAWKYEGLIARTGRSPLTHAHGPEVGAWARPGAAIGHPVADGVGAGGEAAPADPAGAPAAPAAPAGKAARVGVRLALAAAAAALLVAPQLVRNHGKILPADVYASGTLRTMALAFALGWLVMPLVLVGAQAHDRRGPLPARLTFGALARHPLATLAALLVVPVGVALLEVFLAAFTWQQGMLALCVADLYPQPSTYWAYNGNHFVFDFDGRTYDVNVSDDPKVMTPLYWHALRRGYTLTGTVPASLSQGLQSRMQPFLFYSHPYTYLAFRVMLTLVILTVVGLLLSVQARWLGLIVALDARRPLPAAGPPRRTPASGDGTGPGAGPSAGPGPGPGPGTEPVPAVDPRRVVVGSGV